MSRAPAAPSSPPPASASERDRPWRRTVLAVLATAAVLSLLGLSGPWTILESRSWDLLSRLAPAPQEAADRVVLVEIDEPSFAELALRWPWPRAMHARLVEALTAAGARLVAFDIVFAEPGEPEDDATFAGAMQRYGKVVLATDRAAPSGAHLSGELLIEPTPELAEAALDLGSARIALDPDGVVRRLPAAPDDLAAVLVSHTAGAYAKPPSGALIRWFADPQAFASASYYQALAPESFLPPGFLRGRVVLVGLAVATSPEPDRLPPESFLTPLTFTDGRLASGVEIQATAFANLASGLWVAPLGTGWRLAAMVPVLLLAATLLRQWTPARAAGLVLGTWLLAPAASLGLIAFVQLWLPPLLPMAAAAAVAALTGAEALLRERRERRFIRHAFGRYLAPELVERLAADPSGLRLGGERRDLTFLFCDIRGFTSISERLEAEPERLTALVNRFLTALTLVVHAHRGTIDKYMGDCLMSFWGAPLADPDHALHAGRAALDMRRALAELALELARTDPDLPPLRAGIGVNTGTALVGNIGSELRFAYSVLGDPVNLASRLQTLTKEQGFDILVGETTAAAIADRLALLPLARIPVRGKEKPVVVFALVGGPELAEDPGFRRLADLARRLVPFQPGAT